MHRDPDELQLTDGDLRVVDVLRRTTADDVAAIDPPPDVWDALLAAVRAESPKASPAAPPALRVVGGGDTSPRTRPAWKLVGIAAALVLVVAAGAVVVRRNAPPRTEVVASTRLATVADGAAGTGRGAAQLVRRADGTHLLVEVDEMTAADRADFFELWLLDRRNGDPQSLGRMASTGAGTLDVIVPDTLSTEQFPVVDISSEIEDGDASHSGRSVLRGTLS